MKGIESNSVIGLADYQNLSTQQQQNEYVTNKNNYYKQLKKTCVYFVCILVIQSMIVPKDTEARILM